MKPLVSLVTPVYNAMPYFKNYLDCVREQTWRPLEFIVVDDGSADGSWEYLQSVIPQLEKDAVFVNALRREHESQSAAINAALPLISGDFFTWCDADDLMAAESIEKKVEFLISHKDLGMVRSDGFYLDGDSGDIISHSAKKEDAFTQNVFDALFYGQTYCYAGCYMLRTELFFECYPQKQIPLSKEGQNLQLLLPPASRTDCGFLPEALHFYYQRSSGHSHRKRSYMESLSRIENFYKLRSAILPFCACDYQYYMKENNDILKSDKQRLYRLAAALAREEFKKNEGGYSYLS
ncbi:MAG: glycosyltransferase family 2 protein [Clostridium sp.]|nr:glycosyltransferase family 2 protein [Clostridium sp.]